MLGPRIENKALWHRDKDRLARETSRQNGPNKLSIHKNIDFKISPGQLARHCCIFDRVARYVRKRLYGLTREALQLRVATVSPVRIYASAKMNLIPQLLKHIAWLQPVDFWVHRISPKWRWKFLADPIVNRSTPTIKIIIWHYKYL